MSLPEIYMMKSPEPTPEEKNNLVRFMELTEGMDLPKHRILNYDYRWIIRNCSVKNRMHPNFDKLMAFLKEQIK